jgi:hypothetical protein
VGFSRRARHRHTDRLSVSVRNHPQLTNPPRGALRSALDSRNGSQLSNRSTRFGLTRFYNALCRFRYCRINRPGNAPVASPS